MNYTDLGATQRDALTVIVALDEGGPITKPVPESWEAPDPNPVLPTATNIRNLMEKLFAPISYSGLTGHVLPELIDASLSRKERSESDGRVWLYRPTRAGTEAVSQALRERRRWITEPDPVPDHDAQATLPEVLQA